MKASRREIDMIRGKMIAGVASVEELHTFLEFVNELEAMVEEASMEDFYGSEGWEHRLGWD